MRARRSLPVLLLWIAACTSGAGAGKEGKPPLPGDAADAVARGSDDDSTRAAAWPTGTGNLNVTLRVRDGVTLLSARLEENVTGKEFDLLRLLSDKAPLVGTPTRNGFAFANVPAGRYSAVMRAEGVEYATEDLSVGGGRTIEHEADLGRAGVTVLVQYKNGAPVVGAQVVLLRQASGVVAVRGPTDVSGVLRVGCIPEGTWTCGAEAGAYAFATRTDVNIVAGKGNRCDLRMSSAERLELRITKRGRPLPRAVVDLSDKEGRVVNLRFTADERGMLVLPVTATTWRVVINGVEMPRLTVSDGEEVVRAFDLP